MLRVKVWCSKGVHLPDLLFRRAHAEGALPRRLRVMPSSNQVLHMVGCSGVELCQQILEGLPG